MSVITIDTMMKVFSSPGTDATIYFGTADAIKVELDRKSNTSKMYIWISKIPVCIIKFDINGKTFDIDFGNGFCGYKLTSRRDIIYEISLNCDEPDLIESMIDNYCRLSSLDAKFPERSKKHKAPSGSGNNSKNNNP